MSPINCLTILSHLLLALLHNLQPAHAATSPNEHQNLLQINLHPVSSHVRRLESQLEQIQNDLNNNLRHLQEEQTLQLQLQSALKAMEGRSAAYASLMEFPLEELGHSRDLREYHERIEHYNDYYREYSRYEWEERRLKPEEYLVFNKEGRVASEAAPPALIQTSWQVVHLNNTPPLHQISMVINNRTITGQTGCNAYRARMKYYPNNTVQIGHLATTRMACEPSRMEEEDVFIHLMERRRFVWHVSDDELIFSLDDGEVVRFIPMEDTVDSLDMTVTSSTSSKELSITNKQWQATQLAHTNTTLDLHPVPHSITLSFYSDRIGGHAGCNSYGAPLLNLTTTSFTLEPILSTMMYCEGVMEQEGDYLRLFNGEVFYEVVVGEKMELVFFDGDGGGDVIARFVLVGDLRRLEGDFGEADFEEAELELLPHEQLMGSDRELDDLSIIGSEWTALQFASFNQTMHSALEDHPITLGFESASEINGNAGCNDYFSLSATLSTNRITVGSIATTRMICSEEGIMEQEKEYTNLLSDKSFFYKVVVTNDREEETLTLSQVVTEGGSVTEGQIVARFVRSTSESTLQYTSQPERKLETEIKKKGGLFNAYQTTPVHQGYGTHYATMWVGTPPQRKSVIIDTGSHYTAFPCKGCINCGEEHHTDKYFDPDESSTFHALTCGECQSASCLKGKCVFSQSYTEGSSWHAFEAIDTVFLGGRDPEEAASPINNSFKTDFLFGCQVKETGLFVTQLADGIMGMSAHPSTLPKIMYDQEKLEHNMFSICFRRELHVSKRGILAGMLTLGGIDTRADLTPMVYARNVASTGWFTVFVKNIYIREQGGQSATPDGPHQKTTRVNADLFQMNSGKGVIIDSGTTDTYLHKSVAAPFNEVWLKLTGRKYSNTPVALSQRDLLILPTVLVQLAAYDDIEISEENDIEMVTGLAGNVDPSSPQDIILAIPATHYMEYSPSKRTYTPRLYFSESKGGVIGSNAMQRHNVLFDWENRRIGIAESSCEYEAANEKTDEASVEVDCRLSQPSLMMSCSETVDLSPCSNPGSSDLTLTGHEIWTRMVTAPGTMQGSSCEQVAIASNDASGGGPVKVECDGKGICKETRECAITCANANAAGEFASKLSPAAGSTAACGGATWSACDYSCLQTRMQTILMNDGKCYVEKALEFTRPCHVQACGRSDPCRVPFVVHAILKIRGAIASQWNKRSEEVFADAFASTVNEGQQQGADILFGAGDVQVLRASPWKASDDAFDDLEVDEELGMQLVVETSIFNYNAVVAPGTVSTEQTARSAQTNSNNMKFFGRFAPVSSCKEADLHYLANTARDIHTALAEPNFVARIMDRIKLDEATEQMQSSSPFFRTIQDVTLGQQSSVVTSWTIKTDIGTGRSRGLDFIGSYSPGGYSLLLLTLSTSVVIGYLLWSRRYKQWSMPSSNRNDTTTSTNQRYKRRNKSTRDGETLDNDADSLLSLLSDTSDFRSVSSSIATSRGNLELVAQGDVSILSDLLTKRDEGN